jgi:uncharacterized protein YukE
MNDIDQKRKRIETLVKVAALGVAAFFFAPIAVLTIKGLVSLIVVATVGLLVVNVGIPWLAVSLANWRLKALKAAAAANPIETLENQYAEREAALLKFRDSIKEFHGVVQDLYAQIQEHDDKYPGKPSQFLDKYNKMRALLTLRSEKYKQAQANLRQFGELLEEKRSDWKVAQTAARAMKLANVGEDFQSKLMQDTALTTIQDGLNMAFSELEVSLLDEQPAAAPAVSVLPSPPAVPKQLPDRAVPEPPALDLDIAEAEGVPVPAKRKQS